jgi:hypothetical protein
VAVGEPRNRRMLIRQVRLSRSIWLVLILSSSQQTAHGPLQEKAPKIFVENGRAIVYVHPYTTRETLDEDAL